jgi:hypothetical protein
MCILVTLFMPRLSPMVIMNGDPRFILVAPVHI